jgi:hypothetical protein
MDRTFLHHVDWFYPWLKKFSVKLLASEHSVTLQPTALANEVFLKLLAWTGSQSTGSLQPSNETSTGGLGDSVVCDSLSPPGLKRISGKIARQLLVDRGRKSVAKQRYLERSAYAQHQALLDQRACSRGTRVLEVMEAVERLRSIDPVLGDLVFLRYFEGLDLEATAERLGLSRRTAIRRWGFAKAFLKDRILFQEGAIPRSTTDGVANMDSLSKSPQ